MDNRYFDIEILTQMCLSEFSVENSEGSDDEREMAELRVQKWAPIQALTLKSCRILEVTKFLDSQAPDQKGHYSPEWFSSRATERFT